MQNPHEQNTNPADNGSTDKQVAFYLMRDNDEMVFIGSCSSDEFQDKFSKIAPKD